MNVADQRRSKRFDLRLPFELIREGSRARHEAGETMNLSSAGVLFTSGVELEVGAPIEYFITLPPDSKNSEGVRLRCLGKVVRRHRTDTPDAGEEGIAMAATLERYEFIRPEEKR